jgi:sugar (pentulose or hexulose) kinase
MSRPGAALLAAVASGIYPDLEAAVIRAVGLAERIEPDAAMRAAYDPRYQLYRQVYPIP